MSNLEGIEIIIKQGINEVINAFIYPKENACYIDEKKYKVTNEQINNILSILVLWNYEYYSNKDIDLEEFRISVYEKDRETIYHGRGAYPHTYNYFKKILGEIKNG